MISSGGEDSEGRSEVNDEFASTSVGACDNISPANSEHYEEFELPSDMFKTSSGRLVKKVAYADQAETNETRRPKTRRRFNDKSDNEESSASDTDYVRPKKRHEGIPT